MWARAALVSVAVCATAGAGVRALGGAYLCPDGLLCMASPVGLDDPRLLAALAHRVLAAVTAVVVVVAVLRGGRQQPMAAVIAVVAVAAQAFVGVGVERMLLDPAWVVSHLGLSLLAMLSLSALASPRVLRPSRSQGAAALLIVAVASTAVAVGAGAGEACSSWPICRSVDGTGGVVDLSRGLLGLALVALAALAVRSGRAHASQLVLRLVGLLLGADLAVFVTAGAPEFAIAQVALLHAAVVGAWWLLPVPEWLAADRPATSPLPTSAPPLGAPTT